MKKRVAFCTFLMKLHFLYIEFTLLFIYLFIYIYIYIYENQPLALGHMAGSKQKFSLALPRDNQPGMGNRE